MIVATNVGRETVGGSWLGLGDTGLKLRSFDITAGLVSELKAHIRHSVANVPTIGASLYADNGGEPGMLLVPMVVPTPVSGTSFLGSSTGRWLSFPMGRWFESAATVWAGVNVPTTPGGSPSIDLAYDSTGGVGGSRAGLGDTSTWTPGTNDYSMHLVVLT